MFFNKLNRDVDEFAKKDGYYIGAKYIGKWKEYKVYEPYTSNNEFSYTGLPLVILVNKENEIRWSTSDEAMAILDDNFFVDSFENNQREEDQIVKALEDMNDSKMVNTQIEVYFKSLMETQTDVEDEYLSLPVINMADKSNIKLQSVIISSYVQNDKKYYYCQGCIEKDYVINSLPKCKLYENVEMINSDYSMLNVIPKGEYPNLTINELKDMYYNLLDKIKTLIFVEPNNITIDESKIILDYLKLYRYLEKEEIQAYYSLKSEFIIWCLGCSAAYNLDTTKKFINNTEVENNDISLCPHCKNGLTFIQPANSLLYCSNCNKYFENNNGKVGKSVKEPHFNSNVFY